LENWKAYRTFSIELSEGTTFLVAANGVGKSSFLEAVRWALDEEAASNGDVMRRGAESTSVEVDVELGDKTVKVRRTLTAGRAKNPKQTVSAWVNDEPADPVDVFARLAAAWQAEKGFMLRAAFLTEDFINAEPDLRSHLVRLHALDHVQSAIDQLGPAARRATVEADAARRGAAATADTLEEARERATALAAEAAAAGEAVEALRAEVATARQVHSEALAVDAARHAHDDWVVRRDAVLSDIEQVLGPLPDDVEASSFVQAAEVGAQRQLDELAEERSRLAERVSAVAEALERLREAGAECPLCRQPLDDDSRQHAEEAHQHDQQAAADALSRIDLETPSALVVRLRELRQRIGALGPEPAVPDSGDVAVDVEGAAQRLTDLNAALEQALSAAGGADVAARVVREQLDELADSMEPSPAVGLYARAAAYEAAKGALETTISDVLRSQLGPVSEEVNRRWEGIFPDRPGLRIDADGGIARTFDDDRGELDVSLFSAGERMVAKLMLRLATLTATTAVPFCWIDEPLEHLDPDARRYVGRTLAFMSGSAGLRQIFVTTYEEQLAVQLAAEAPDEVRLVFLHAAPVPS
jgi:DNA repair exonuclease SbcCD ATPase subunit